MSAGAATNKQATAQQQFHRNVGIFHSGTVPEILSRLEDIRKNIKQLAHLLPKEFIISDVIPVLQELLEKHTREIDIHVLYILYFLLGDNLTKDAREEFTELFDGKLDVYIHILRNGVAHEGLCRIILGVLRVLCNKGANKIIVLGANIAEILLNALQHNPGNAKVYNGVVLLIIRLISSADDPGKTIMLDGNLYEPLMRIFESTVDEENEDNLSMLFYSLAHRSPSVKTVIRDEVARFVSIANRVGTVAYIRLDKMLEMLGFTVLGKPINEPYTLTKPKFYEQITPIGAPATDPKNVYITLGHGREHFEEELLVPDGCVYVTFAVCGQVSKDVYRIQNAFADPEVSVLLSDPVRNLRTLTAYFGESLHVHYPGARNPTSRTYYDTSFLPFVSWQTDKCTIGKSGIYRLGGGVSDFSMPNPLARTRYVSQTNCNRITRNELRKMYEGSIYPTYNLFVADLDSKRYNTYDIMVHNARKFRFSQSWAFKMFPGVHYNFLCRGSSHPGEEPPELNARTTEFIARRRGLSNVAALELLDVVNISGAVGGGRSTRRAKRKTRRSRAH